MKSVWNWLTWRHYNVIDVIVTVVLLAIMHRTWSLLGCLAITVVWVAYTYLTRKWGSQSA